MSRFRHRLEMGGGSRQSAAGLIPSTLFGLVFAGIAVMMGAMVFKGYLEDQAMLAWEPVECSIVRSSIVTVGEGKYSFTAEYQYERNGRTYTGLRYCRESHDHAFEKVSEKTPLLKRYPVGITATCYVNPVNPADSVLTRADGRFPWPMLLFICPFVVVGLGVAFGPWIAWARRRRGAGFESPTRKGRKSKRTERFVLMVFGIVFAGAGVAVGFQSFSSLRQYCAASAWVETPAVVTVSDVRSHRGSDSTTYRPYIAYAVEGQDYEGDRYDFWNVSSSGYEGKAAIVRAHPIGREIRIFVDPANPAESVINRRAGWGILFHTLFPMIFIVVGGTLFVAGVRIGRASAPGRASGFASVPPQQDPARHVPIQKTGRGRFIGTVFFALFWNGIVSVFVVQAWRGMQAGHPDWMLIVFLIPFVLIGLGAVVGILFEFLRLFNPKFEIISEASDLSLGKPMRFRYRMIGSADKVSKLTVSIHGSEQIRYRSGKSQSIETFEFFSAVLFATSDSRRMVQGDFEVVLPDDSMHTFKSAQNEIIWRIKVQGTVAFWPDIKDEHIITVRPMEAR